MTIHFPPKAVKTLVNLFLVTTLFSQRTISLFAAIILICADERSAIYFLLSLAIFKIPSRICCALVVAIYSASDVLIFILVASLLTFLASLTLSSTFALVYLLNSGFTAALLVVFKNVIAVLQINFVLTLCFATAQYIFVTAFAPSGTLSLLSQLPIKLTMLALVFFNTLAAIPSLLVFLFVVLASITTSARIVVLLGSIAQTPSFLNLFFDMPDLSSVNFVWYSAMLILIFIMFESALTSLLGYSVLVGLPLTLPLLLKFILLAYSDALLLLGLVVPWILAGIVLGNWSLTSWLKHGSG